MPVWIEAARCRPGGIAQAVKDADIAGATHLLPMEAPRPVAAAITAFL